MLSFILGLLVAGVAVYFIFITTLKQLKKQSINNSEVMGPDLVEILRELRSEGWFLDDPQVELSRFKEGHGSNSYLSFSRGYLVSLFCILNFIFKKALEQDPEFEIPRMTLYVEEHGFIIRPGSRVDGWLFTVERFKIVEMTRVTQKDIYGSLSINDLTKLNNVLNDELSQYFDYLIT